MDQPNLISRSLSLGFVALLALATAYLALAPGGSLFAG